MTAARMSMLVATLFSLVCLNEATSWGNSVIWRANSDGRGFAVAILDPDLTASGTGYIHELNYYAATSQSFYMLVMRPTGVTGTGTVEYTPVARSAYIYPENSAMTLSQRLPGPLPFESGDVLGFFGNSGSIPIAYTDDGSCSSGSEVNEKTSYNPSIGTDVFFTETSDCFTYSYSAEYVDGSNNCVPVSVVSGSGIYIRSPGRTSDDYQNNLDVCWLITAPTNFVVRMSKNTFQTESSDYVAAYDGVSTSGTELLRESGSPGTGGDYKSTGLNMYVRFTTDGSVTDTGFSLFLEAVADENSDNNNNNNNGGSSGGLTSDNITIAIVVVCTVVPLVGLIAAIVGAMKANVTPGPGGLVAHQQLPNQIHPQEASARPIKIGPSNGLGQQMVTVHHANGAPPVDVHVASTGPVLGIV